MTDCPNNDNATKQPKAEHIHPFPHNDVSANMFLSIPFLIELAKRYGCEVEAAECAAGGLIIVNAPHGYLFCACRSAQLVRTFPGGLENVTSRRQVVAELGAHIGCGFYRNPAHYDPPPQAEHEEEGTYEVTWTGTYKKVS